MPFIYPDDDDFRIFIGVIKSDQYPISKYIPAIDNNWYKTICDCVDYVRNTAHYEQNAELQDCAARMLYKVAKRHELGDGNKRSAIIAVYLFVMLNGYYCGDPAALKREAIRAARSKGRTNEEMIRKRIARVIAANMYPHGARFQK